MNVNLESESLFGGVSGAVLPVDEFQVCEGLVLRKTYAHVMAPYVVAFRRPEQFDSHHPGPWKSARGGVWQDVEFEIALERDIHPTGFDRVNTLWWLLALLRLCSGASLRLPVVSNLSFSSITEDSIEPDLWPVETLPRQFHTASCPPHELAMEHLNWAREIFVPGARMMEDPSFGRALQAFDGAIWAHGAGSALVTIWASLETLIAPGKIGITKRLAKSIAALLEPPGSGRDRMFTQVSELYEARGGSAHASRAPEAQQLLSSFEIGRRCFVSCMDRRMLPNVDKLQESWRLRK